MIVIYIIYISNKHVHKDLTNNLTECTCLANKYQHANI